MSVEEPWQKRGVREHGEIRLGGDGAALGCNDPNAKDKTATVDSGQTVVYKVDGGALVGGRS